MTWNKSNPGTGGNPTSAQHRQQFSALEYALFGVNMSADPTHLIWPGGDAADPAHRVSAGTGSAIERCGTGLTDTSRKVGAFCPKLTSGAGAASTLTEAILDAGAYDDFIDGLTFTFAAWVKCSSSSAARLSIDDGDGTPDYSSYHSGSGDWEWLTVTSTISASATKIDKVLNVAANQNAHISGDVFVFGEVPPASFMPSPKVYGAVYLPISGTVATGTEQATFGPARPLIVKDVQLHAKTAPTDAALIVDVNHWDGSAWQSMFSTLPQLASGAKNGGAQPDGTYRYRCFTGLFGTTDTDALLGVDIDQVGSTVAGANLGVHVRALQFARPLEDFLAYDDVA